MFAKYKTNVTQSKIKLKKLFLGMFSIMVLLSMADVCGEKLKPSETNTSRL